MGSPSFCDNERIVLEYFAPVMSEEFLLPA